MARQGSNTFLILLGILSVSLSAAAAAPAVHLNGPRRMLQSTNAAVVANEPKYHMKSEDIWLPLCAAQISSDGVHTLTGNEAAQAAWKWNSDTNGETVSAAEPFDSCQGQLSNDTAQCWTGAHSAVDHYFKTLVCVPPPKCTTHPDGSVTCVGR